ncbi:uncharacterized protein [Centruroides vittatus]|uniref:uncharacterized protein n=1 Tax=Centruroides vittatus TaxID=120091 RepID=UPI003510BCA3
MLLKFQRRICIRLIKGYRTISRESAILLANKIPLDVHLKERYDYFFIKSTGTSVVGDVSLSFETQDSVKSLPHPAYNHEHAIVKYDELRVLKLFTDGSRSARGVGAAFAFLSGDQVIHKSNYKLHSDCSIVQAETLAVRNSLNYIIENEIKDVLLCTDSKTVLTFLTKPKISTKLILETYKLFQKCVISFNTQACWIKSHGDCPGNDLADALATSAYLNDDIAYSTLPLSFARALLRGRSMRIWETRWQSDDKGAITHKFFPTVEDRQKIKYNEHDSITTTLLSQHGKLNYYLHRFKIIENPNCNCGLPVPDTIEHILYDCSLFDRQRMRIIAFLRERLVAWPVPCNKLTSDEEMFNLVKDCFGQCAGLYGPN